MSRPFIYTVIQLMSFVLSFIHFLINGPKNVLQLNNAFFVEFLC